MNSANLNVLSGWPRGVREAFPTQVVAYGAGDEAALRWFFGEGRLHPEVRRYTAFLKTLGESYQAIAELYDHWSPPDSAGTKNAWRLTHPHEQLYLANHLYVLASEGVSGDVLECGCAHGFSSACLSLACAALGRRLIVADSFEGLPDTRADEPFFRKGDYAAPEARVLDNIRLTGRVEVVETVKGWFKDSLVNWSRPLAMVWMDVDLYESARDLLPHALPCLDPRGALFTHEYTDFYGQVYAPNTPTVPGAIHEYFAATGTRVRTELLCRYWGVFGRESAVALDSHRVLDILQARLGRMDPRWRNHAALRNSRTVRTAMAVKKLLLRR